MRTIWTFEKLQKEALKYKIRGEFKIHSYSAYNRAVKTKNLALICKHMAPSMVSPYTLEELETEAKKYSTRKKFDKGSRWAYSAAWRAGILDKICKHMVLGNKRWTTESIQLEALKYKTRTDFQKGNPSAYQIGFQKNILDLVCSHMIPYFHSDWTVEEIKQEALKYESRSEFDLNSPSAYSKAIRIGILDSVCVYMKKSNIVSLAEIYLFDTIKSIYPTSTRLMDRKVKIKGKPHICGFGLDIFVPELNLGIEFDGIYWHSFEGLRRSRHDWPDEDILNYHKIKDSWFASKGIQVLHINEADWIADKEICIKKCINFLSSNGLLEIRTA